eukprot:Skav209585  [mRNA]  locus=scaffold1607:17226:18888:- [translate_table: standard]
MNQNPSTHLAVPLGWRPSVSCEVARYCAMSPAFPIALSWHGVSSDVGMAVKLSKYLAGSNHEAFQF